MAEVIGIAASVVTLASLVPIVGKVVKRAYSVARGQDKIGKEIEYFASTLSTAGDSFNITLMTLEDLPARVDRSEVFEYLEVRGAFQGIQGMVSYLRTALTEILPVLKSIKADILSTFLWLVSHKNRLTELMMKVQFLQTSLGLILQVVFIKRNRLDALQTEDKTFRHRLEKDNRIIKRTLKNLEKQFEKQMTAVSHGRSSRRTKNRISSHQLSMDSLIELSASMRHKERVPPVSTTSPSSPGLNTTPGMTSDSTWTDSSIRSRGTSSSSRRTPERSPPAFWRREAYQKAPVYFNDISGPVSFGEDLSRVAAKHTLARHLDEPLESREDPKSESDNEEESRSIDDEERQDGDDSFEEEQTHSDPGGPANEIEAPEEEDSVGVHEIDGDLEIDLDASLPIILSISKSPQPETMISVPGNLHPSLPTDIMSLGFAQKYNIKISKLEQGGSITVKLSGEGKFVIYGRTEPVYVRVRNRGPFKAVKIRFFVFDCYQSHLIPSSTSGDQWEDYSRWTGKPGLL